MSIENVQTIIGKAIMETEYRELLFTEPDNALEDYELTEEEKSVLKGMERDKFDTVASELEDRISRAGMTSIGIKDVIVSIGTKDINSSFNQLFGGDQFNIDNPTEGD